MIKQNRAQRRKDAGVNKRGLHQPQEGKKMLIIYGVHKYLHFVQKVPIKNKRNDIIFSTKFNFKI